MVKVEIPGTTTISISVGPSTKDAPKGGNYNRMEKILVHRKEPWNDVLTRLLDYWDEGHKDAPGK